MKLIRTLVATAALAAGAVTIATTTTADPPAETQCWNLYGPYAHPTMRCFSQGYRLTIFGWTRSSGGGGGGGFGAR